MTDSRRMIPGVDTLLASEALENLLRRYPRERVADHLRGAVASVRERMARGEGPDEPADHELYARIAGESLARDDVPSLRAVINATGVVLHTNLGRSPLPEAALEAMAAVGPGYSNLEFDLEDGQRGSRYVHCTSLLRELTGSEDALVVNNCAAALVLAVNTVAAGGRVIVSRGELVEIGGGFRIPDILGRSGANLVEVGSTNRTRINDYEDALKLEPTAAVLKVHRSNFRITGFTEEADLAELSALAHEHGAALIHDVGSGLLLEPSLLGLPEEPRPATSLSQGADVAVFSGDKLLGGPQAGLIVGTATVVAAMRRNPLCRALRVDKVTLAGLEATLRLYRDPSEALERVPTLRMLTAAVDGLEARARALVATAAERGLPLEAAPGRSAVGGGTFPGVELPSWTVTTRPSGVTLDDLARRLRAGSPPLVARREEGALVLDLRTVLPEQDEIVLACLVDALEPDEA